MKHENTLPKGTAPDSARLKAIGHCSTKMYLRPAEGTPSLHYTTLHYTTLHSMIYHTTRACIVSASLRRAEMATGSLA